MAAAGAKHRWGSAVRQVTKSNFKVALGDIRAHIQDADFIAVSTQKTGDSAASSDRRPWRRVLAIDTPETAYLKAKRAAETFELLQIAVCPFRLHGSKLVAFPYNFHLFPRDELNLGMPSYSFLCQTSYLTSMAREGFDFNLCIYDGISYLSREQESMVGDKIPIPHIRSSTSTSSSSVADSIFRGRIKSRVENWWNACKDPGKSTDGCLVNSLRKLLVGGEVYGSRPCMSIDVCSERQVQLVLEIVCQISDDLVPLVVPDKGGEPKAIRIVLTSSEEDRSLLMNEIKNLEEEENLKMRGFREVIDLISNSNKPIIGYNCLHDFTFIHSKFLSPLPPSLAEFRCSLRLAFSNVLDVSHLLKDIGPLRKANNIPSALSYFKKQFFAPIDVQIPQQADGNTYKSHGHNVLRLTHFFAKLNTLLKLVPDGEAAHGQNATTIKEYANIFYPCCTNLEEPENEDVELGMDNVRKVSTDNLVFFWGFHSGSSAMDLKRSLCRSHSVFSEDFELQLVDRTCAVVVFWRYGSAEALLKDMESQDNGSSTLKEIMSEGLKAAGFEAYEKVCRLGLWEADLADSLDKVLSEPPHDLPEATFKDATEIYWCNEFMINLSDL